MKCWFRDLPIRHKLVAIMMLISCAVLGLSAGTFLAFEARSERRETVEHLTALAEIAGDNCRAALAFGDVEAAVRVLAALEANPSITAACVVDADGRVFARYGRNAARFPERFEGIEGLGKLCRGEERLCIYRPIFLDGDRIGGIYLQTDLGLLHSRMVRFSLLSLAILLFSALLAYLLSRLLQRLISRPVVELTEAMARITSEEDFTLRLAAAPAKDEIGQLVAGFNAMLRQIDSHRRQLEEANTLLENRVTERTAELHGANAELRAEVEARREAEAELRVKESAIASAINPIAMAGPERRITYVNQAFLKLWGYEREEQVLGRRPEEFWKRPEAVRAAMDQLFQTGAWEGELVAVRRGGSLMDVQITAALVRDESGEPLCFMTSFLDVTERKQATRDLEQYGQLFENVSDMVVIVGSDGLLKKFNPSFIRTLGYAEEELRGRPIVELIHPDDRQTTVDEMTNQMQGQFRTLNFENRYVCKDGSPRWFSWNAYYKQEERLFLGIARDITERKQSDASLRTLEKALDTTTVGITITDPEGVILYANPAEARMHGYTAEELLGRKSSMLGTPELRSAFPLREALTWARESRNLRKDGRIFPVWLVSDLVAGVDGTPLAVVTVCEDITERKQAEQALRQSLLEKEALIREVHHRVKNNLQIISSLLNLQMKKISDEGARIEFNTLRGRIRSMALIHERLYQAEDLSRIDFSRYVREFARQIFRLHGTGADRVRLVMDLEEATLDVDVAIPCGMIINELLTNALKYAFPAERRGKVVIRLRADGAQTVLSVEDDGIGLPGGGDSLPAGTLGLQLVRSLAAQINATVAVEVADGTRVTIRCAAAGRSPQRAVSGGMPSAPETGS
jgi:PAS domain S-box-containing protein